MKDEVRKHVDMLKGIAPGSLNGSNNTLRNNVALVGDAHVYNAETGRHLPLYPPCARLCLMDEAEI